MALVLDYDGKEGLFRHKLVGGACVRAPFSLRSGRGGGTDVVFPAFHPAGLIGVKLFKAEHPDGMATSEALERIQALKDVERDVAERKVVGANADIFTVAPYDHQKDVIERMMHCERMGVLLEQGLGKTYISIMAVRLWKRLGIPHRTLVVCPKIVFQGWFDELRRYAPELVALPYLGSAKERGFQREAVARMPWDVLVTTYDMLIDRGSSSDNAEFFAHLSIDNIIADEASRLISHESKRSNRMAALAMSAKRVYLLSGTLCVGRPTDMYMPMRVLSPSIIGMDWDRFQSEFCIMRKNGRMRYVVGYKNTEALKAKVDPYIVAKTRDECLDLPERIFLRRFYEVTPKIRNVYNGLVTMNEIDVSGRTIQAPMKVVKIGKCLQALNGFLYHNGDADRFCADCVRVWDCVVQDIRPGSSRCGKPVPKFEREIIELDNPKLDLLREDLADGVEKTIIWAWYQHDLQVISRMLKEEGIGFVLAGTPDCVRRFNEDAGIRVFLGQTVQGIGITLNAATQTIYYSHGMALEPRLQSMDRNYRIGQRKSVVVKDYLCRGSVEETLVELLAHKTDVKEYMQRSLNCFGCRNMFSCLDNGVGFMREGCIHADEKRKIETKRVLALRELR